jgi:maleylacetoacetate isomerase
MAVVLYGYWRSLATFRVRAALKLKGVDYQENTIDLSQGEQFAEAYHSLNPQNVLPLLDHDGLRLTQSMAIAEYINDTWPHESLLPADAPGRARVRALAQIASADVHPLIVPRVRNYLEQEFGLDEATRLKWIRHWFTKGTLAIEAKLSDGQSGTYAHGDQVSLADLALASHVVGARLFQVDLSMAPRLEGIVNRCLALDAFASAHPLAQVGAPGR